MFLSNALRIGNRAKNVFSLNSIASLKAWYKYRTNIDVTSQVDTWISSATFGDVDDTKLEPPSGKTYYDTSTGSLLFRDTDDSILQTSNLELNLGQFTIFAVVDVVESGAANEMLIGRLGNDELRLYRGSFADSIRLRADGVNYDFSLTDDLPTGVFLLTLTRASNGLVEIRVNKTLSASGATDIAKLFDFTRVGNGASDLNIYEIAIFDTKINADDITAIENDMTNRIGI